MHICRILMHVAIYEISDGRFKSNSESANSQNYEGNVVRQQFSLSTKQFLVAPKKKKIKVYLICNHKRCFLLEVPWGSWSEADCTPSISAANSIAEVMCMVLVIPFKERKPSPTGKSWVTGILCQMRTTTSKYAMTTFSDDVKIFNYCVYLITSTCVWLLAFKL